MGVSNSFKIIDDRFSIDKIENYDVLMEIQQTRFKFILRDIHTKTIIWLEDYYLGPSTSHATFLENLKEIIDEHEFIKANFWNNIAVTVDFPCFAVTPNDLFDENLTDRYLKLQNPDITPSDYELETIKLSDNTHIFLIPKTIRALLNGFYPNKILQITNSFANSIRYFQSHERIQNKNLLLFSDEWLEAIFIEQKSGYLRTEKIALSSRSIKDFMGEIEGKGQLKTLIFGEITPYSSNYRMVKSRLKALEFGGIPRNCTLSQFFSEIPEQRYFSILNVDF